MDKELENLLDNYERSIYGKEVPKMPTIHQIHLLLDYIANLEQQCKKQKEVIDKAIEYIYENLILVSILDGTKTFGLNSYTFDYKELLDILKEVSE